MATQTETHLKNFLVASMKEEGMEMAEDHMDTLLIGMNKKFSMLAPVFAAATKKDPNNNEEVAGCQHKFTRGKNKGEFCNGPCVEGADKCKAHNKEKSPRGANTYNKACAVFRWKKGEDKPSREDVSEMWKSLKDAYDGKTVSPEKEEELNGAYEKIQGKKKDEFDEETLDDIAKIFE